jgi:putative ABC transport system permease protein
MIVIGVVRDIRQFGLNTQTRPELYVPSVRHSMYLTVSTNVAPADLKNDIRREILAVEKGQPAYSVKTMAEVLRESIEKQRLAAILLSALGAIALLMSAMGIYGVMAYTVNERTLEIGIRMALGARQGDILRMVMRQGIRLALIGVAAGIAGAIVLSRLMSSLLYGVSVIDPITFCFVTIILAVITVLACLLPALRAGRVEPMVALRHE